VERVVPNVLFNFRPSQRVRDNALHLGKKYANPHVSLASGVTDPL
jgi:hypothetical protein